MSLRAVSVVLILACSGPVVGAAQGASTASARPDSAAFLRAASDSAPSSATDPKPLQRERKVTKKISELEPEVEWQWSAILATAIAMVGAILLTLPVAAAYKLTKPPEEYDPSVMHSSLILAPTIAGILIVIQGSLAVAFSLAGVATAVRFRNSLKDTNDAVYVFVAIAIGLAAGVQALDIGLTISLIFTALMLLLWKTPFRNTGSPEHQAHKHHHHQPDPIEAPATGVARSNGNVPASPPRWAKSTQDGSHEVGSIVIRASEFTRARSSIEPFLQRVTKRWRLEGPTGEGDRDGNLRYTVRCRKRVRRAQFLEELRALASSAGFSVEAVRWWPVAPIARTLPESGEAGKRGSG